jgi:2-dehydrotetronate isomerase
MPRFSANLGFLWTDLSLPDAIRAAAKAGFDAVECHWPYSVAAEDVRAALQATGLPMLGLNTSKGNVATGDNGLAALTGREDQAKAAIDQAIAYAAAISAANVHVMAGFAEGQLAHETYIANLRYAAEKAHAFGISILIEPLSSAAAPGYFLNTTGQAKQVIEEVGAANVKLMFDCFHVQMMEGDVSRKLASLLPIIGHIQFAGAPDRGPPDQGELNYRHVFNVIDGLGYREPIGAEYRPGGSTDQTLSWMKSFV